MADDITPGAVVVLKSGGPKMTVMQILSDRVACTWFDNHGVQCNGGFPRAGLIVVRDA